MQRLDENRKPPRKLKVVAYCRVSTKAEQQQLSLGLQEQYYRDLIDQRADWEFTGIYLDVASGTSQQNRPQFNSMIESALQGKIDLIIAKSVSRFGRNTLELLETTRLLKQQGIDIYFETVGLYLQQMKSELILTILAAAAQNYSERKSGDIKWGIHAGFQAGTSKFADKPCYGYKRGWNGLLEIVPEQAEIVRNIFNWYLQGDSFYRIASKLYELQIPSPTGKEKWTAAAISKLLSNEKYTGDVILQKTYIQNFWNHTQAENDWVFPKYLYENNNPAIISKEMFEQVRAAKSSRSNVETVENGEVKRKSTRHSSNSGLSGKIRCTICGRNYRRITTHSGEIVWRCAGRVEKQAVKCTAPTIITEDLIPEINRTARITDLHLDFLVEIVDHIDVGGARITVILKDISAEKKSELLHKQDHWLAHYSLMGESQAKEALYKQHVGLLKRKLYFLAKQSKLNHMDIEDLEQTVWLKVFSRLETYNSQYRFWTWMRIILQNAYYTTLKYGRRYLLSESFLSTSSDELQIAGRNNIEEWERSSHVNMLLSILSEREQEIIVRHIYYGETQLSISQSMGCCHQRIHQIYARALRKMRNIDLYNIPD